jgi:hypothetical protein
VNLTEVTEKLGKNKQFMIFLEGDIGFGRRRENLRTGAK